MNTQPVPVLNIIGPVGIGKSSTAAAVAELLVARGVPHATIDLDDVRRAWPAPESDYFNMRIGFKNLAAVWANYRDAGTRCLIIPSVMESQEDLAQIRAAVPGADVFVVRLTASLEVNHARIAARETSPDSLAWHLNRSTQLDRELSEKRLEHLVIDTDSKTAKEVALDVLAAWTMHSRSLSRLVAVRPLA